MGCGDTWLVEQLMDRWPNHQYVAVDIAFSDAQLHNLRQRLAAQPLSIFDHLEAALPTLNGRQVDVVLLLDVIEHIEDEQAFLRWMQTFPAITAQTQFVITVPAYQALWGSHDVALGHYRRYTRRLMRERLVPAGLAAHQQGYFFASLLLPRLLQVLRERLTKPRDFEGVGNWTGGHSLTQRVQQWLWQDYRLGQSCQQSLGLNLPGLSHYTIATAITP
jgi:hypothetical protein